MCDPGDEHAEHVAPQPAGVDGAPADQFTKCLANLEAATKRLEQARQLLRDAKLEVERCRLLEDACYRAQGAAMLAVSCLRHNKDFDWRGLVVKPDPPVRLNRANNSWEET
jgi:hypothetical protein